jgi:hypothetical protein
VVPTQISSDMSQENLVGALAVAGALSLGVLGIVGRRSYRRKIVQLTKELEKEGKVFDPLSPPKVWAVLSPSETIKVFAMPLTIVLTGTTVTWFAIKKMYRINDIQHGMDTVRWLARVGPPPASTKSS